MSAISGTSSVYASILSGLNQAQQSTLGVARSLSGGVSDDSLAAGAVALSQAKTQTEAMVLLAKTEDKLQKQTLDILA